MSLRHSFDGRKDSHCFESALWLVPPEHYRGPGAEAPAQQPTPFPRRHFEARVRWVQNLQQGNLLSPPARPGWPPLRVKSYFEPRFPTRPRLAGDRSRWLCCGICCRRAGRSRCPVRQAKTVPAQRVQRKDQGFLLRSETFSSCILDDSSLCSAPARLFAFTAIGQSRLYSLPARPLDKNNFDILRS